MIPSESKDVSIKFADQYIHILNNEDRLNGIKVSTQTQRIVSIFKHQSRFYNVQSNKDVKHRGTKMRWNNKLFPSLNVINGKPTPYRRKGIIRHYHYRSDPKLGPGIVSIRGIKMRRNNEMFLSLNVINGK